MARPRSQLATQLVALSELAPDELRLDIVGSSALALSEAARVEVPILDAWVLSADAFRETVRNAMPPAHDPASLLRIMHRPAGIERAARARERLQDVALPETLESALRAFCEREGRAARWGFAILSSPTCGDDAIAAMAGLFPSVHGVRGAADLGGALRRIWSSCFDEETLRYLRACRIRDVAMAVIVERLEPLRASGTMLTEDPHAARTATSLENGGRRLRVACTAFGLGMPASDGVSASDVVRFDDAGSVLEQRPAKKPLRLVVGAHGTELAKNEHPERPALGQRAISELSVLARSIEQSGDGPRLVEFVVPRRGAVSVVAVRRVSGLGWPMGGGPDTVWTRIGLGESLPAVPTALSASLARAFEERGLGEALEALGAKKLARDQSVLAKVHGRFFLNMSTLAPKIAELPGIAASSLLDLVPPDGVDLDEHLGVNKSGWSGSIARMPLTVARLHTQQRRVSDEVQRFEPEAEHQRRWLVEMDLAILPDDALKTTLIEAQRFFRATARLHLRCSVSALATHLALKTVLARSTPVGAERLAQLVTAGVGDLDTVLPGSALLHVVAIGRRDPAARDALLSGCRTLADLAQGPTRRALAQFLEAYGERGLREAELAQPRYAEAPQPLLEMMTAGLRFELGDPDRKLRDARVAADRELAALEARIPLVEKALVRALVGRARELTRLRERMRLWLTRTLSMLRTVVLDVDRRLRRLDGGLLPGDAFHCTFDELVSAVGSSRADLGPIVRLRRAALDRDAALPDPPETFVGAPPALAVPPLGRIVLHGAAAGAGTVVGTARVIGPAAQGASTLEPGDVLVVRALDLGLVPLLFIAGGVVAELGGGLSHGAVAARECGLPAVVGVPAATVTIADGELVRVDGDRGVVERLGA